MFPTKQPRLSSEPEGNQENQNESENIFPLENMDIPPLIQPFPEDENDDLAGAVPAEEGEEASEEIPDNVPRCVKDVALYLEAVAEELKKDRAAANESSAKKRPHEDSLPKPNFPILERELTKPLPPKNQPNPRPKTPEVQHLNEPTTGQVHHVPVLQPAEHPRPLNDSLDIYEFENSLLIPNPYLSDLARCEGGNSDYSSSNSSEGSDSEQEEDQPFYIFGPGLVRVIRSADPNGNQVVDGNPVDPAPGHDGCNESVWLSEPVQESDVSSTTPEK